MKNPKITIDYSNAFRGVPNREFKTKRGARDYILTGLRACEGAEREHYADMLLQFEDGKTTLMY